MFGGGNYPLNYSTEAIFNAGVARSCNPTEPLTFPYSSFPDYLGLRQGTICDTGFILKYFKGNREAYKKFVLGYGEKEAQLIKHLVFENYVAMVIFAMVAKMTIATIATAQYIKTPVKNGCLDKKVKGEQSDRCSPPLRNDVRS